jgi:crotonobetainyl-CoA:carnitine CoA-transferase CaiB-like acyl-CoA transferase
VRGRIFSLKAGDGLAFIVHLSAHDSAWQACTRALGAPQLGSDDRYARWQLRYDHHPELQEVLQGLAAQQPRAHWLAALDAEGVPCAPAYTLEETFEDPQVRHLGIPRTVTHPRMGDSQLVGEPVALSGTPAVTFSPAPLLGEQTEDVLTGLGYDRQAIFALREQGVI